MKKAIIGRKVGMTQIFDADGKVIPVTVIQAGPCVVVQKKTAASDGYDSVQLGYDEVAEKKLNKPENGHIKKAGVAPQKVLHEFRLEDAASMNVGDVVRASVFAPGDCVDVVGTTKGHGYSGVVKRWNQAVQCHTHGVGPVHRSVGSMGANTDPSRVMPGKHMPGQYGVEQVTIQNLDVVKVDDELNVICVRGAVPGPRGGIVYIKNTVKNK
ncbi:MAG: 50S ribosomal protein L3 [Clostridiaceae bacterium]|nr:50S ribosomal protein L3 [Clostridiales bacterium]MDD6876601.1 50S ribosomal protein L3 [Clostridiaceae bacterium]MDY3070998.1 50S ribosomal protein L3 [Eubacteriales bacterium]MDY3286138.1 50S ribosomal protein L3 [Eubacteriales bacterium]MDY5015670.1 50S ribosomal protein L3 [Eubacteriales bacterium]